MLLDTTQATPAVSLEEAGADPIASIRTRPGFTAAVRHSTLAPLARLDDDPRFYRCIGDIPTYAMAVLLLYLDLEDRLHHRSLQQITGRGGLFSAGRVTATLWRLQAARLIAPSDPLVIGKRRRYAPDPAMREAVKACYRIELESLRLMDARAGVVVDRYEEPAVFETIISSLAKRLLAARRLDGEMLEPLGRVGRRSMGLMITYSAAAAAFRAGRGRAEGEIEINISDLARRMGVSRAHTRRILALLEPVGLKRDKAELGRFVLTSAFTEAYETYFAGMFMTVFEVLDRLDAANLLAS